MAAGALAVNLSVADVTAVVLAGGQGRRMGGEDKGLLEFDGQPLIAVLIEQLEQQMVDIVINANRNLELYAAFGYEVIADRLGDFQGPLAGFASAMARVETGFILTLPCDGPLLAEDYVVRFVEAQRHSGSPLLVAHDGERLQPVHALISTQLLPSLESFLAGGERKIDRWYAKHDFGTVDFSNGKNMFRNINTPADRDALETRK